LGTLSLGNGGFTVVLVNHRWWLMSSGQVYVTVQFWWQHYLTILQCLKFVLL